MDHAYCPYCMSPVKEGEPCPSCGLTGGSYHPQPHHLPPGTLLANRYLLGRVLGEGGFGITYIGCDTRLELRVAVKEYFPQSSVTRNSGSSLDVICKKTPDKNFLHGRDRFIREAQTMAKMDKTPQIVGVRDFFQENNTAYIVMEFVEGVTFKELVEQRGSGLPAGELLEMMAPLFGALESMHKLGVIHRDISPDNIMLESGRVKLLDFGCARETVHGNETMTLMVKHGYSPVEQQQHKGKGQGPWSDVYSLAATIYFCLTAQTPPQVMDRLCGDELVPPRRLGADLTEQQELALLYGMGLQPSRRFQSIQEFYASLYQGVPVPLSSKPQRHPEPEAGEPDAGEPEGPKAEEAVQKSGEPKAEEAAQGSEKPKAEEIPQEPKEAEAGHAETAASQPREPVPEKRPAGKKKLAAGIAAVAAVVAIICIAVGLSSRKPPDDGKDDPPPDDTGTYYTLPDGEAQTFLDALADDSVKAIQFGPDMRLEIDEPVEIAKPIVLAENSGLYFNEPVSVLADVTVGEGAEIDFRADTNVSAVLTLQSGGFTWFSGDLTTVTEAGRIAVEEGAELDGYNGRQINLDGGSLEVDGHFGMAGLLRTLNGGRVAVGPTGWAGLPALWLESQGDLSGGDRVGLDQNLYLVADENVFADAVHVNSFQELEEAAGNRLVPAIVVDGNLAMEYHIGLDKPLLISEGAEITAAVAEEDCGLNTRSLVINRGQIEGIGIQAGNGGAYVNYGQMDGDIYCEGGGMIFNLGDFNARYGQWRYSGLFNQGTMRHETTMGEGYEFLDMAGGSICNNGDLTIASGNRMLLTGGSYLENSGSVRVEEGAALENNAHFSGPVTVAGTFSNEGGILELNDAGDLTLDGGTVTGGIILTRGTGVMLENNDSIQSTVLTILNDQGSYVDVTDANELTAALYNAGNGIRIPGGSHIVLDEPVTVRRSLFIDNGASLTVNGVLTVEGSTATLFNYGRVSAGGLSLAGGAQLQNDGEGISITGGGTVELNGGTAVLWRSIVSQDGTGELHLDGGAKLVNWDTIEGFNITVDGGSYLADGSNLSLPEGTSVRVNDGTLTERNNLQMAGGSIEVGEQGVLMAFSNADLGGVELTNHGSFSFRKGYLSTDENTRIVNYGSMVFGGWEWQDETLVGSFENRGYLELGGNEFLGLMDNYGEIRLGNSDVLRIDGELRNHGTFFTDVDGSYTGSVTGNPLEYR